MRRNSSSDRTTARMAPSSYEVQSWPPELDIDFLGGHLITPPMTLCGTEPSSAASSSSKVESHISCELCGYRPKGDPKWFKGSLAKHRKLKHSPEKLSKIYSCPYPGCTSAYKGHSESLKRHQIEKNHFVVDAKRPSKRPPIRQLSTLTPQSSARRESRTSRNEETSECFELSVDRISNRLDATLDTVTFMTASCDSGIGLSESLEEPQVTMLSPTASDRFDTYSPIAAPSLHDLYYARDRELPMDDTSRTQNLNSDIFAPWLNWMSRDAPAATKIEKSEPPHEGEDYILRFSETLCKSLRDDSSVTCWKQNPQKTAKISHLIISFSVKLATCSDTPQNRIIMEFLQNSANEIAAKLAFMLDSDSRQILKSKGEKSRPVRAGSMSVEQKMSLWDDTGASDNVISRILPSKNHLKLTKTTSSIYPQGSYEDFEQRTMSSPAYQWLVAALRLEAHAPMHTNHTVISDTILQSLPDSSPSTSRLAESRIVTFIVDLSILDDLKLREGSEELHSACIVTGPHDQQRATTFTEHVCQTWPWAGPTLVQMLPCLSVPYKDKYSTSLPDGTVIRSNRTAKSLRLEVCGPLISVAECGDVLARLALAPYQSSAERISALKPSVQSIQSMDGWKSRWKSVCNITYDLQHISLCTSNMKQWHSILDLPLSIDDLTMDRFPVDASGIEISYKTLQRYLQGRCEVVLQRADFLLQGRSRTLKLADSDQNTYLWDDVDSPTPCDQFKTTPLGDQLELALSRSRHFIKNQTPSPSPVDSDLFSLSDTETEVDFDSQDNQLGQLYSRIAHRLWAGFCQHRPSASNSSVAASGTTTLVGSQSTVVGRGNHGSKSQKRGKAVGNGGDEDECDDYPDRPSKKTKFSKPAVPKPFACPFWKDDQRKHRDCFKNTLTRLRDVKQHLTRRHSPPYCTRCLATFKTEHELEGHSAEVVACMRDPSVTLDGISNSQRTRIHKRADPKLCEQDQWFALWDIIFPGKQRPKTAYVDPEMAEELSRFQEYALAVGPNMLAEEIESHESWSSGEMSDEERSSHLRRIIESNYLRVLDSFVARNSTSSSDLASQTSPPAASTTAPSFREEESTVGGPMNMDTASPSAQRAPLMTPGWNPQYSLLPSVPNTQIMIPTEIGNWTMTGSVGQAQMLQHVGSFNNSMPLAPQPFSAGFTPGGGNFFADVAFGFEQSMLSGDSGKANEPAGNSMRTQIT